MLISAVVCTRNGARRVAKTLDSLHRQDLPISEYEVLVVDNASEDDTEGVVRGLADRIENLRYIFEPEVGLSAARNCAIQEARAELLAFIDDDAVARPSWLSQHLQAYASSQIVAAGGRVELVTSGPRPTWLKGDIERYYSAADYGSNEIDLDAQQLPVGTNMSIRRSMALTIGGFRTDLGRRGSVVMSSEETAFFLDLLGTGGRIRYMPGAIVDHYPESWRMNVGWLVRRSFHHGRGEVLMNEYRDLSSLRRLSYMVLCGGHCGVNVGRTISGRGRSDRGNASRVLGLVDASIWAGKLVQGGRDFRNSPREPKSA